MFKKTVMNIKVFTDRQSTLSTVNEATVQLWESKSVSQIYTYIGIYVRTYDTIHLTKN